MGIILINAQGYDNILISKDEDIVRFAIHSTNATLSTKLTPTQVQNLIDALQKVLNETAA
jgi:hypothetical protein